MAMDETNSLIEQRKAKLAALRAKGIDPFKNKFTPTEACAARPRQLRRGPRGRAGRAASPPIATWARACSLTSATRAGASRSTRRRMCSGDEQFDIFKHLDLGDFIGVRGHAVHHQDRRDLRQAASRSSSWPRRCVRRPEKWHGLADTEIRYRQRYLDLIANPEVKRRLPQAQRRSSARSATFLHERGYVEVETPMMQAIPGGAAAQPFKTLSQRAGLRFLPAHRAGALPQAPAGRRHGQACSRSAATSATRASRASTTPSSPCSKPTRPTAITRRMMELVQSMICHVAQKVLGTLVIEHKDAEGKVTQDH